MEIDYLKAFIKKEFSKFLYMPENCFSGWIAGSLVEGIGNKSSDIDIFIICNETVIKENTFTKTYANYSVQIHFLGETRLDFEYWQADIVGCLADKLNGLDLSNENINILNTFNSEEIDFIHRLKTGICILNESYFAALQNSFDFVNFRKYLVANKILYVDDAFDDTVGMLESGQINNAVLRARFTVEMSIDALLYNQNITNDKAKYRYENLFNLAQKKTEMRSILERFWLFESHIPSTEENRIKFVQDALAFSSEIIESIQ